MQGKVQHYMFVSSAGAYNANSTEPMHVEGDPRKSSAGEMPTDYWAPLRRRPILQSGDESLTP